LTAAARYRRRGRIALALSCALFGAATRAGDDPAARPDTARTDPRFSGVLTAYYENDVFFKNDDNYTAGVGASWVSDDVATYGPKRFERRVVNAFSFLPKIGDDGYRGFASFTIGQEMYTPTDIDAPVPPPDQQPYAGVLFLDSSVYAHGRRAMYEFKLRVGCVGPCSGAEQVQKRIHEWIGSPIPQGWDHQLSNELLLNFGFQFHRRSMRRDHQDLAIQAGGELGNYYTGANVGAVYRVGFGLPDTYSAASLRTGGASRFVGSDRPPGRKWRAYLFAGVELFGIARFLPTDGNTFVDSPSVDRSDFVGALATGIVVGRGPLLLSWTRNTVEGFNDLSESRSQDFGTLTFSYYHRRRSGTP
jgi:hypothetical protein